MSVHLSGTVGGGLSPAYGDPNRLESLAGRLDALAEEVLSLGHDGLTATTGIAAQAGWTGTAAEKYLDVCRTKTSAVAAMSGPLHEIAAAVRGYAAVLAGQQRRTQMAVRSVEGLANAAADPHLATQAEWQVVEATGEVHSAVYQAANRVEAAKSELGGPGFDIRGAWDNVDEAREVLDTLFSIGVVDPARSAVDFLERMEVQRLLKARLVSWEKVDGARLRYELKLGSYKPYLSPSEWRGVRATMTDLEDIDRGFKALGLVGDVVTVISPSPESHGVLRAVDRGAGAVQAVADGATLLADLNLLDVTPGVGEVIMAADVVAGVYFGAEYVVQHWSTVKHVADTVATAELNVAKTEVRLASGAVHAVTSSVRSLFRL